MREPVKTKFTWDDLGDSETFMPCKYCHAEAWWPVCDDGATTSACNHCEYNIVKDCLDHNVEKNNYSLKGVLENRIKEMGYTIVGEWRDSLKNGWRIEVKIRMPGSEENYRYSTVYAEELLCDMLHEELSATRGNRNKMLAE